MSEDSSKSVRSILKKIGSNRGTVDLPWSPITALFVAATSFILAQVIGGIAVVIYAHFKYGAGEVGTDWVKHSTLAQFVYILITELLVISLIILFLKAKKISPRRFLGLTTPDWRTFVYAGFGFFGYWVALVAATMALSVIFNINTDQEQALGFSKDLSGVDLAMALAGLVILPPLAEEILFRGFFFGTLRKYSNFVVSTIVTSIVFGVLHLFTSADGNLLWIAAIDTFVLSTILCYLREKTGSLWASILLHAMKNGMAFFVLFILKR